MGLSVSNKKDVQQEEKLHQIFDGIKSHLNEAFDSVDKSHTYFKIGLEDDFVNYLNKYAENPFTMISHSFDGHMDSIRLILEEVSQKFFLSQSKNIYKVFQSNPKRNFLHFYIILKEDTLKHRRPFPRGYLLVEFQTDYGKDVTMKVSLINLLRVALGICFICLGYQILDKINADGHLWMTFLLYLLDTLVGAILARVEGEKA